MRGSVGADGLPFAVFAVDAVFPRHFVAIDASAKGEDVAGFGAEDNVMDVDGAFEAAGLIGSLEVTGELVAVLCELDVFGGGFVVVDIFGIDGPLAFDVVWRLFGGRLLGKGDASYGEQEKRQEKQERPGVKVAHDEFSPEKVIRILSREGAKAQGAIANGGVV